jgi:hypothetical protein
MKHLSLLTAALLCLAVTAAAQVSKGKNKEDKMKAKNAAMVNPSMPDVTAPYTATFSSQWKTVEDARYANIALTLMKDMEENQLNAHGDWLSDSIVFYNPENGTKVEGKSQVMEARQKMRDNISTIKQTVSNYATLHSADKNVTGVLVEGTRQATLKDGTDGSGDFFVIFGFDSQGKVAMIKPYRAPHPKGQ